MSNQWFAARSPVLSMIGLATGPIRDFTRMILNSEILLTVAGRICKSGIIRKG
ncbi:unnamed protein product [Tuwongella immobilis]|uniref:Uncharacterized protein n=1 Tax=Tuwongella immobilis TaxID=692036 RepID=A0A6C2YVK8_9BACT|nr:unnamed protein product [Tuwongella immobilis]VTS08170.1 unnamed protein product [Tuwongella immobilis]